MKIASRSLNVFVVLFVLLISCTTSKSLVKKGKKFEAANQYERAADFYYQAVEKNPNNLDAILALSEGGKRVMQNYMDEFFKAYATENYEEAVNIYLKAERYQKKVAKHKIKLEIPSQKKLDFEEAKSIYFEQVYNEGLELIELRKYEQAEKYFAKIYNIDPDYEDVAELKNIAHLEPKYIKANQLFESGEYYSAYDLFNRITQVDATYKDCVDMKAQALELGKITLAVTEYNKYSKNKNDEKIKATVTSDLLNYKDPFLKIVDRENIKQILNEQEFSLSGMVDQSTAVQAGELLGAQYVLLVDVNDHKVSNIPLTRKVYSGFEQYRVKVYNKATQQNEYITKYKPVKYTRVKGGRSVYVSTQYKLISLTTGEILTTKVESKTLSSEVDYIIYSGKSEYLYASSNGSPNKASSSRNSIKRLARGNQNLLSVEQLSDRIYKDIGDKIAQASYEKLFRK